MTKNKKQPVEIKSDPVDEIMNLLDEGIAYNRQNKITSALVFFDQGQAREDLKKFLTKYFSDNNK